MAPCSSSPLFSTDCKRAIQCMYKAQPGSYTEGKKIATVMLLRRWIKRESGGYFKCWTQVKYPNSRDCTEVWGRITSSQEKRARKGNTREKEGCVLRYYWGEGWGCSISPKCTKAGKTHTEQMYFKYFKKKKKSSEGAPGQLGQKRA